MSIMIWIFLLGALLGSSIGVMITCLCGIAKRADERSAQMLNGSNNSVKQNGDDSDTFIEDVDMDTIVSMERGK